MKYAIGLIFLIPFSFVTFASQGSKNLGAVSPLKVHKIKIASFPGEDFLRDENLRLSPGSGKLKPGTRSADVTKIPTSPEKK